jgi:predicted helicase
MRWRHKRQRVPLDREPYSEITNKAIVLKDFGAGKAKHDPVVHFYETFLGAYDPEMREVRGVYYTPEPVVSYIVRSVDLLLQKHFDKPKGLADEKTLILDPAVGTATFLFSVIQQIYARFAKQEGAWDGYVSEHLLNRVFGFELLMAPYAVAHLKLGMELQETGYKFGSDQRLGIYLTNTLEEAARKSQKLFAEWISEEANAAAEIKRTRPILVVLGNPPYSGHSANRSRDENGKLTFIGNLIEDYKQIDGQPLGERNPKWLQDDYVKFIRFAQWRIERTGHGILGFVTNHGYLDNPTFRGMRQSLMHSYGEIHVYDLHGNTKKPDISPDGSKDENVFDIQQGVAIILAVKDTQPAGSCEGLSRRPLGSKGTQVQRVI